MALTVVRSGRDNVLVVRVTGMLTLDEVTEYQARPLGDLGGSGLLRELFDLSGCRGFNVTHDDIDRIAAHAARRRAEGKLGPLALLAPSDLAFGMGRMYEVMAERLPIARPTRVCRSREEALAFLGLPQDWKAPDE